MDDFKTLAAGTFLNDVIINFYLKYLQYDVFSEADRDRYVLLILVYIYFIQNNIKDAHFHHLLVLEALTETKSHRSQKRSSCEEVYMSLSLSIIRSILLILGVLDMTE